MVYADFRGTNENKLMRDKLLINMVNNWESDYSQTLPTFDDKLSKIFSQKYMKKNTNNTPSLTRSGSKKSYTPGNSNTKVA